MTQFQSYVGEVPRASGPKPSRRIFDSKEHRFENPHLELQLVYRFKDGLLGRTKSVRLFISVPQSILFGHSSWALKAKIVGCKCRDRPAFLASRCLGDNRISVKDSSQDHLVMCY